jgi:hypothetical protein
MSSPWDKAYQALEVLAETGATEEEMKLCGDFMCRSLPLPSTPEEHAQYAAARARAKANEQALLARMRINEQKGKIDG